MNNVVLNKQIINLIKYLPLRYVFVDYTPTPSAYTLPCVYTVRSKRVNNNIIRWVELLADGSDMQVNL